MSKETWTAEALGRALLEAAEMQTCVDCRVESVCGAVRPHAHCPCIAFKRWLTTLNEVQE